MPSLLITTAGASDANSWATLVQQKYYAEIRTPHIAWIDTASDTLIEQRMILATLLINNAFDWEGEASSEEQRLAFPRKYLKTRNGFPLPSDTNPIDLINAQCEMTLQLGAADLIKDNKTEQLGVQRVKAGDVEVEFQEKDLSSYEAMDAAILRMGSSFNYLSNTIPGLVRMMLVPSWYKEAEVVVRSRRMRFKVLG
jgi:hypothetical protein